MFPNQFVKCLITVEIEFYPPAGCSVPSQGGRGHCIDVDIVDEKGEQFKHLVGWLVAHGQGCADLQAGMLAKIGDKIRGTDLERRITLHQCAETGIGLSVQVDFALLFYLVHEIPDKGAFFSELTTVLRPGGQALMVEPPFHVSKAAFAETVASACGAGLTDSAGPRVLLSKTVVLIRE